MLAFVIPTLNSEKTLGMCLKSLFHFGGYVNEIVIVDGGSQDRTIEIAKQYPVKILFEKGKKGIAFARNLGWRKTHSNLIAFFESDAFLGNNFFPKALGFFKDQQLGVLGCTPKPLVLSFFSQTIGEWWTRKKTIEEQKFVKDSCVIIRRECLEAVGGFDDRFRFAEFIDLTYRIWRKGWKVLAWNDAPLYHIPQLSLPELMRDFYKYGMFNRLFHLKFPELSQPIESFFKDLISSFIVGGKYAKQYRNPLHLLVFPLARLAWRVGYEALNLRV